MTSALFALVEGTTVLDWVMAFADGYPEGFGLAVLDVFHGDSQSFAQFIHDRKESQRDTDTEKLPPDYDCEFKLSDLKDEESGWRGVDYDYIFDKRKSMFSIYNFGSKVFSYRLATEEDKQVIQTVMESSDKIGVALGSDVYNLIVEWKNPWPTIRKIVRDAATPDDALAQLKELASFERPMFWFDGIQKHSYLARGYVRFRRKTGGALLFSFDASDSLRGRYISIHLCTETMGSFQLSDAYKVRSTGKLKSTGLRVRDSLVHFIKGYEAELYALCDALSLADVMKSVVDAALPSIPEERIAKGRADGDQVVPAVASYQFDSASFGKVRLIEWVWHVVQAHLMAGQDLVNFDFWANNYMTWTVKTFRSLLPKALWNVSCGHWFPVIGYSTDNAMRQPTNGIPFPELPDVVVRHTDGSHSLLRASECYSFLAYGLEYFTYSALFEKALRLFQDVFPVGSGEPVCLCRPYAEPAEVMIQDVTPFHYADERSNRHPVCGLLIEDATLVEPHTKSKLGDGLDLDYLHGSVYELAGSFEAVGRVLLSPEATIELSSDSKGNPLGISPFVTVPVGWLGFLLRYECDDVDVLAVPCEQFEMGREAVAKAEGSLCPRCCCASV